MERMKTNTLRDLVWYAIDDACDGDTVSRSKATTNVLAALGLDDLDALATRTLAEVADDGRRLCDVDPWHIVWVVLKAAFFATEGGGGCLGP